MFCRASTASTSSAVFANICSVHGAGRDVAMQASLVAPIAPVDLKRLQTASLERRKVRIPEQVHWRVHIGHSLLGARLLSADRWPSIPDSLL